MIVHIDLTNNFSPVAKMKHSRVAYRENRSLCDTSTKLGTYSLHMILIMKNICSQFEKSKMVAKIQDGRHRNQYFLSNSLTIHQINERREKRLLTAETLNNSFQLSWNLLSCNKINSIRKLLIVSLSQRKFEKTVFNLKRRSSNSTYYPVKQIYYSVKCFY